VQRQFTGPKVGTIRPTHQQFCQATGIQVTESVDLQRKPPLRGIEEAMPPVLDYQGCYANNRAQVSTNQRDNKNAGCGVSTHSNKHSDFHQCTLPQIIYGGCGLASIAASGIGFLGI
jgi:hypothetical protein